MNESTKIKTNLKHQHQRFSWPKSLYLAGWFLIFLPPSYCLNDALVFAEGFSNSPSSQAIVNPAQFSSRPGSLFDYNYGVNTAYDNRIIESSYTQFANQKIYVLPMSLQIAEESVTTHHEATLVAKAEGWPLHLGIRHRENVTTASSLSTDRRQIANNSDEIEETENSQYQSKPLTSREDHIILASQLGWLHLGTEMSIVDHVRYGAPHYRTLALTFGLALTTASFETGLAFGPKVNFNIDNIERQEDPAFFLWHFSYFITEDIVAGIHFGHYFNINKNLPDYSPYSGHVQIRFDPVRIELSYGSHNEKIIVMTDIPGRFKQTTTNLRLTLILDDLDIYLDWHQSKGSISSNDKDAGKAGENTLEWGLSFLP